MVAWLVRFKEFVWTNPRLSERRFLWITFALFLTGLACQLGSWAHAAGPLIAPSMGTPVQSASQLPAGLILPVRLENTLSLKYALKGQLVEARIMQDVPLPDRGKLARRSVVRGPVLALAKDTDGSGVHLTLAFNQVEDRDHPFSVFTSLRAIASVMAVHSAQMPWAGADSGTPSGWANTTQIGSDIRFGDGGPVRNREKQNVGKGVRGGVLVHVHANPSFGCEGPINGDDHPQALWVFSADACGVYEMKGVEISHTGKTTPLGEITIHFEKDDVKLEAGTGMLLRVVAKP